MIARAPDRELEREGRRLGASGGWILLLGVVVAVPGALLVVLGDAWAAGIGIGLLALAAGPLLIGVGLLLSGVVWRRQARHKPFA